ncbi:hypothetical protein DJ568_08220 [Mucilaginibacter hurinus]|uniref:PAS domain-containing protein n=1 Tax=Mucilaginibacter hurinus TaxID=2201324 RepID=A0A367GNV5_9SPHI|nr:PAS domain S-box protein [Mucilaginibacter hurinus]RCH55164.1 hypothetical protein DJ568_08220 [Mucilaginibacter hurinus]
MNAGALKIAVIYVVAGILWITLSDQLLLMLQNSLDIQLLLLLNGVKGIGYVLITGLLLYKLINMHTKRLAESEKQYRSFFDYNSSPMWIINRRTMLFTTVNDAATVAYGYSRHEFLTMSALDISLPEDINKLIGAFKDLKTGINCVGVQRHVKKNGDVMTVEITVHVIAGQKSGNVMLTAIPTDGYQVTIQ